MGVVEVGHRVVRLNLEVRAREVAQALQADVPLGGHQTSPATHASPGHRQVGDGPEGRYRRNLLQTPVHPGQQFIAPQQLMVWPLT